MMFGFISTFICLVFSADGISHPRSAEEWNHQGKLVLTEGESLVFRVRDQDHLLSGASV